MSAGMWVAVIALAITATTNLVAIVVWGTRLTVAVATLRESLTKAVDDLTAAVKSGEDRHELLRTQVNGHEATLQRHDEKLRSHSRRLDAGKL